MTSTTSSRSSSSTRPAPPANGPGLRWLLAVVIVPLLGALLALVVGRLVPDDIGVPSNGYGSDVRLDLLAAACSEHDFRACDDLYDLAPDGTGLIGLADTCNDLIEPGLGLYCFDLFGYRPDRPPPVNLFTERPPYLIVEYGTSSELDDLFDRCARDDFAACDDLYHASSPGTDYRLLADTCNHRLPADSGLFCHPTLGPGTAASDWEAFTMQWEDLYRDACAGGDYAACDRLAVSGPIDGGSAIFGGWCGYAVADYAGGTCAASLGRGNPDERLLGNDEALDSLAVACDSGDLGECDRLFIASEIGTEHHIVAATCGGRSYVDSAGSCATAISG